MSNNEGPIYGGCLIDRLPIGGMMQAMPSRKDLKEAKEVSLRTVAGYEVLLSHYLKQCVELERLKGNYSDVTKSLNLKQ